MEKVKFNFDAAQVNNWIVENVDENAQSNYFNFVMDLTSGVPFNYSKGSMYNVNDCVYIHKSYKGDDCDFWIYLLHNEMKIPMKFSNNTLDTEKVIKLVKLCWKYKVASMMLWNTITTCELFE